MILRRTYFVLLVMNLWGWGEPIHAQTLIQDFEILFERCRLSIETNSAFNIRGLESRDVPKRHARDWGKSSTQDAWALPESKLYVSLTQWTSQDGTERRLCDIGLIEEEYALREGEQAVLLRHFLIRKFELIGAGTHQLDNKLSPIPPVVILSFLLLDRNPRGCIVINTFSFSPDGEFFSAGSGEQAVKPCEVE